MKYLHIMPPSQRMMRGYLLMLRKYFNCSDHTILFSGPARGNDVGLLLFENTIDYSELGKGKIKKYRAFSRLFSSAEHIVFHQFSPNIFLLLFLFFHRKFLKKSIWVIWGIDLYNYKYKSGTLKAKLLNYVGYTCRKYIGIPVVLHPMDIDVYRREFGEQPVLCAPYDTANDIWHHLDELIQEIAEEQDGNLREMEGQTKLDGLEECSKETTAMAPVNILVGHNAHVFNRHREVLNILERFNQENIMLHLPLSYGNDGAERVANYPRKVKEYAKILFPQKVKTLEKLMDKWRYDKFLASIDIAVLGAPRQNALGNIIRLLYMGKKVYLAPDNPLYEFLKEKGFHIYSIEDLKNASFEEFIAPPPQDGPHPWLKEYYSTASAARQWKQVFDYAEGRISFHDVVFP